MRCSPSPGGGAAFACARSLRDLCLNANTAETRETGGSGKRARRDAFTRGLRRPHIRTLELGHAG